MIEIQSGEPNTSFGGREYFMSLANSWKRNGIIFAVLAAGLLFVGLVSAHDKDWQAPPEARKVKNPVHANADNIAAAHAIYNDKCASCHGDKGDGDGPEAEMYTPAPAVFTDAHMMSEMTDGEIFWKMTEGRKPMPSFKKELTDEQRWELVNFLRTFAPKPPAHPAHGTTPPKKSGSS
jgi:mono/diheme cytochrome c family protein